MVRRRLTQLDEWPRHQTLDTFDMVASDSPQWSDGSWICAGDPEGRCQLITALRYHPNNNVVDGYAMVSLDDDRQYNLRVSRRMRPDIDELSCGPLWMEIVEGLRTLRFGARENPSGIAFDLTWEGASPCFDESPGVRRYQDGRIVRARSNYVQIGHVAGTISVGARTFTVDPTWVGARDHSWGVGDTGTGNGADGAAPATPPGPGGAFAGAALRPFGLRHVAFVRFRDRTLFYRFHCSADGIMSDVDSWVGYPYDSNRAGWSYEGFAVDGVELVGGHRRVARTVLRARRPDGGTERYEARIVSRPGYMQGGGYWDGYLDGRGRGVYRGEDALEHDVWDISHPTIVRDLDGRVIPQRNGAWAEAYATFTNLDDPIDVGLGELEAVIGGPYPGVTED